MGRRSRTGTPPVGEEGNSPKLRGPPTLDAGTCSVQRKSRVLSLDLSSPWYLGGPHPGQTRGRSPFDEVTTLPTRDLTSCELVIPCSRYMPSVHSCPFPSDKGEWSHRKGFRGGVTPLRRFFVSSGGATLSLPRDLGSEVE